MSPKSEYTAKAVVKESVTTAPTPQKLKNMSDSNYPKYYILDSDIPVMIYRDGDDIVGENYLGYGYSPLKAMNEGAEVTKEEYEAQIKKTLQKIGRKE